jgi:hypothetical protein
MKFSDDHAICIDTGASCCISNCKDDLIPFAPSSSTILKGISGGLSINGTGTLKWNILDDNGDEVALYIHNNLYIPDAPMCLLSPQHMAQQTPSNTDGFISKGSFGLLTFGGFHCTIYYNSSNNLPILFLTSNLSNSPSTTIVPPTDTTTAALLSSIDSSDTSNLTSNQQRLLHLHCKLGHLHMTKVQQLAKSGIFGLSFIPLSTCDPPLCIACLHGKQHRSSSSSSTGVLDALHLSPRDCVSGDQLESTTPGLIPTFRGSPTTEKYHAGTLFVNHASRFLHFTPHVSTGSREALNAKHRFELLAFHHNRSIKCYHTDNGIFASKDFRQSCLQQKQ